MNKKFELPKEGEKVIKVRPVFENAGGLIKDQGHAAFFQLEGTAYRFTVPKMGGKYKNVLTNEEKTFFESYLGLEENAMSIYKKKDNYWKDFFIKIGRDGISLDLSQPLDYIKYKVLLSNTGLICPNYKDRTTKATYKYYIEDRDEVSQARREATDLNMRAYKAYGKIEEDRNKLISFLKVYGLSSSTIQNKISKTSKLDFLQSEVTKIIDENKVLFVELMEDPTFDIRLTIAQAMEVGAIERDKGKFYTPGKEDLLGNNVREVIEKLSMNVNQDLLLTIESRIKTSK